MAPGMQEEEREARDEIGGGEAGEGGGECSGRAVVRTTLCISHDLSSLSSGWL